MTSIFSLLNEYFIQSIIIRSWYIFQPFSVQAHREQALIFFIYLDTIKFRRNLKSRKNNKTLPHWWIYRKPNVNKRVRAESQWHRILCVIISLLYSDVRLSNNEQRGLTVFAGSHRVSQSSPGLGYGRNRYFALAITLFWRCRIIDIPKSIRNFRSWQG